MMQDRRDEVRGISVSAIEVPNKAKERIMRTLRRQIQLIFLGDLGPVAIEEPLQRQALFLGR
jgi:hypothetical protein